MKPNEIGPYVEAIEKVTERMAEIAPSGDDSATQIAREASRNMQAAMRRLPERLKGLRRIAETRSPTETPEAHEKRVAKAAQQVERDVEHLQDVANELHNKNYLTIENIMERKTNFKPNEYAAEFRAMFRGLESGKRFDLVNQLVERGRGQDLAAILTAPAELSGLTPEMQGQFREMLYNRHAPDEVRARDALSTAFTDTLAAVRAGKRASLAVTDPARLKKIEAGEKAAQKAQAEFENG